MAQLKCWKRAMSGESKNYPRVWRSKKDGDDVVRIKQGKNMYLVERDTPTKSHHIAFGFSMKEANKRAKGYMERFDKC